jgi:hypothetical protein
MPLLALFCAALAVSIGFADSADSKRLSKKVIRPVSKKRLAGAYSGVTEQNTPVSFTLTRRGKIVDFAVPVTLSCETDVGDLDGNGTYTYAGGEIVQSIKSGAFRSAPLSGRKKSAQYPFGTTFEYESPLIPDDQPAPGTQGDEYWVKAKFKEGVGYNIFRPIPKKAAEIEGEVLLFRRNGPLDSDAPGRERCTLSDDGQIVTHVNALDFDAKKTGK